MPFLIDGHNLIPKIPGLSLRNMDDEVQLIQRLQVFHQHSGKKIEVFFDNTPPEYSRTQHFGTVTAHFIRQGSTADAAIQARLDKLGRGASTWIVVSSDRQVQAAARAVHARVIKSEDFAAELAAQNIEQFSGIETSAEINISPDEVDEWLRLFGRDEG